MKRWIPWTLGLTVLAVVAWLGWSRMANSPTSVSAATVERGAIRSSFVADGVVRTREVRISPKLLGRIVSIDVREGETVRAGQVLARLDSREAAEAVSAAEADVRAAWASHSQAIASLSLTQKQRASRIAEARAHLRGAEAELRRVEAGARPQEIEQARQRVREARALAEEAANAERRARALFEEGAVSRATLERAEAARKTADAQLAGATQALALLEAGARREEVEIAREDVAAARAGVLLAESLTDEVRLRQADVSAARERAAAAESRVRQSRASLQDFELRATIDCVVQDIVAEPGETASPQVAIMTVVTRDAPWVEAEIADQDAGKVAKGQELKLSIPAYPGRSFKAVVEDVAPHAQLKPDIAIRTRIVRVRIRPLEGLDKLRPGLEVDVFGESVAARDALWIPSDALVLLESETAVFVLEGGVARKRVVETGFVGPDRVEIVSGLREGERVVTRGKDLLTDGSRVQIEGAGRASGR